MGNKTQMAAEESTSERGLKSERGAVAFEYALVFPFFILLFLLLVDLGMMTYHYVSASNAVREGARYGAVNCGVGACTEEEVRARTIASSAGTVSETSDVIVVWLDANGDGLNSGRGDSVAVRIDRSYSYMFFPASIPIFSCAEMRLEQTDGNNALPSGDGC